MGTQLIDTAKANNLSFSKLLELPQDDDPEAVIEELRRLELEIEEAKKNTENANNKENEMRYEDVPMIPTNKLKLDIFDPHSAVNSSDFIVKEEDSNITEKLTQENSEKPVIKSEESNNTSVNNGENKPHDKFDTKISNMLKVYFKINHRVNVKKIS